MKKKSEDPRRKFLVEALTLGLFTGFNVSGLVQPSFAMGAFSKKLPPGKSIYKIEGDVFVDGNPANLDTVIRANSMIETGANGKIIFAVGTDAFILRDNSKLQLGGAGLLVQGMRILTGRVLSVFGKREVPPAITTITATIGIRGTGIYIESDSEKSYVCTCYGQTRIRANTDPNVTIDISTKYHDKPVYVYPSRTTGNNLIVKAPVINHSDAELDLIERLVGRRAPFVGGGGGDGGY
ncbi:MAG: hypothetical protein GY815_17600 [Gammaproteobacteria bacterium]|nr:hypothetical protein [Gammaproteobacteria bacterium]